MWASERKAGIATPKEIAVIPKIEEMTQNRN